MSPQGWRNRAVTVSRTPRFPTESNSENAFARERLVKRRTTRFRGNAMDVASGVRSVRRPVVGGIPRCPLSPFMTPPGVAEFFLCGDLRASAGRGRGYHGLDACQAYGCLGMEARLVEQPRVLRFGAPAAGEDGEQPDVQVLGEVR